MAVLFFSENDSNEYDAYILSHEYGMLYYTNKYRLFLEKTTGQKSSYLISKNKLDQINGVFPLMVSKGKYGDVWNALPFYGSHGSILSDNSEISEEILNFAKNNLFQDILSFTIICRPDEPIADYIKDYNYLDERIGQWSPLFSTQEALFDNIDSSTRRNVRKAKQENLQILIDNNAWDFLENTHRDNMALIGGTAKEPSFFTAAKKYFKAGEDYNIYVAYKENQPISALLLFYFGETVEYFTPVNVSEFRSYQASALIINQAMLEAYSKGFKFWNWGGTWKSQEGVYKFKKKWGAIDRPYHYYTWLKNNDILKLSQQEILDHYPNFYVLPFSVLN